jgi:carbamoyl-phosphate synthase large subunit
MANPRNAFCCFSPNAQDEQPYIIEANPRASRTVPFVAKAVGHPIAKYASLLMSGKTLKDIGFTEVRYSMHVTNVS